MLITTVALLCGCTAEIAAPRQLQRHLSPVSAASHNMIGFETGFCSIGDFACGGLWVTLPESGYWAVNADVGYNDDLVTGKLALIGDALMKRESSSIPEIGFLSCTAWNAHECADFTEFRDTCGYETNDVSGTAKAEAYKNGVLYSRDLSDSNSCEPAKDAAACQDNTQIMYDPTYDPAECSGGSSSGESAGGGGTPAGCTEEYVIVEISYDNGATWTTIWEGWADVC
jgi:hypothetical protein